MIASEQVEQLRSLLEQSQSIFVIFGESATIDHVAVALALQHGLQQAGKDVLLVAPQKPGRAEIEALLGLDQLVTDIGNQNLTVSFPYHEAAVDKVSYHIGEETQRFYLTVKPRKGAKPLDSSAVEFSYTGADTDLIFLVGVPQLSGLKDLYVGYEEVYETKPLVTINSFVPDFGTVHLDTSGTASMSEAILPMMRNLGLSLSTDTATNLLAAIEAITKGFQSLSTTAETFESVAELLRMGARRVRHKTSVEVQPGATPTQQQTPEESAPSPVSTNKTEVSIKPKKKREPTDTKAGGLDYQPTRGMVQS